MKNQTDIHLPTLDEIRRYNEGTLGASRTHELELLALENPLVADALEGYHSIPAYTAMPRQAHFLKPRSTAWWKIAAWSCGVAALGMAAFVFLQPHGSGVSELDSEMQAVPEIVVPNEPTVTGLQPVVDSLPVITENARPVSPAPENYPQRYEIPENSVSEEADAVQPLVSIAGYVDAGLSGRTRYEPELIQLPEPAQAEDAVVIKHIQNYKVVDYGSMRHNTWPPFDIEYLGTPAMYENPENINTHASEVNKALPYISYMKQCIESFYKGNYNRCLGHFSVVLEQYPDDANAQFYGGMCYFKKGEFAKAIASFDKSLANTTKTFTEEAMFYKGMSLKNLGKSKEACVVFKKIMEGSSFYRHDARKEYESCTANSPGQ